MSATLPHHPSLHGKAVLVTGAASGLGAALARRLAAAGAAILGVDLQAARRAEGMARLREHGAQAHVLASDIAEPGAAPRVVAHALELLGKLDVLVNNAGTDLTLPIGELADSDWLRARHQPGRALPAVEVCGRRHAPPGRRAHREHRLHRRQARLAQGQRLPRQQVGLLGLSHALHAELRPDNNRVTAMIAGGMRTPFLLDRVPGLDADSLQDPDDVADAIHSVLVLPPDTVAAELTVLPLRETSWP